MSGREKDSDAGGVKGEGCVKWWMSFASNRGFLGVIIVIANTLDEAQVLVTKAGINPGGEIASFSFTESSFVDPDEAQAIANLPLMKLLSAADLTAAGVGGMSLAEAEADGGIDMDKVEDSLELICECCNPPRYH